MKQKSLKPSGTKSWVPDGSCTICFPFQVPNYFTKTTDTPKRTSSQPKIRPRSKVISMVERGSGERYGCLGTDWKDGVTREETKHGLNDAPTRFSRFFRFNQLWSLMSADAKNVWGRLVVRVYQVPVRTALKSKAVSGDQILALTAYMASCFLSTSFIFFFLPQFAYLSEVSMSIRNVAPSLFPNCPKFLYIFGR